MVPLGQALSHRVCQGWSDRGDSVKLPALASKVIEMSIRRSPRGPSASFLNGSDPLADQRFGLPAVEIQLKALRAVAEASEDAAECRLFLDMLGINLGDLVAYMAQANSKA